MTETLLVGATHTRRSGAAEDAKLAPYIQTGHLPAGTSRICASLGQRYCLVAKAALLKLMPLHLVEAAAASWWFRRPRRPVHLQVAAVAAQASLRQSAWRRTAHSLPTPAATMQEMQVSIWSHSK